MDTMGGDDVDNDSYGRYDDRLNEEDKLSVDLDDVEDNQSDSDSDILEGPPKNDKESSSGEDLQKSTNSSGSEKLSAK